MNENKSAFPVFDVAAIGYACIDSGVTARQYAAIHLKVPRSGDQELDEMIRESRRMDFVGQAMGGMFASEVDGTCWSPDRLAKRVFEFVDAMLVEWENEIK